MVDEPENPEDLNWDIKLDFNIPAPATAKPPSTPPKPHLPPREVLKQKFPRILDKIELLWGTLELHHYFEETEFMDREKRQGFPDDVMEALSQLNDEHQELLMRKGLLQMDVFDLQFREVAGRKPPGK